MKAVILAGGKGTRLRPYTTSFPKPLVPVGDKPILEILMNQLASNGITNIILTVGHLEELIRAYFGDGNKFGVKIKYSLEDRPLGTVGPLTLIKNELEESFFLINGDILSDVNYKKIIENHIKSKSIATITLVKRDIIVDFGVVELDKNFYISEYHEKPKINYYVSTGINIFEPKIFNYIEQNKQFDLPDLIKKLIKEGEHVNTYIHNGYWLDVGRPEDYEKACNDVDRILGRK